MIEKITFDQILPIWRDCLWPERESDIDPTSAMNFLGGYDLENMKGDPTFFAYFVDGKIAGVNSGHMCKDQDYRSRGLYVFDQYRGRGIATELLKATIEQGRIESATMCWSYPRQSSWKSYANAGFMLVSEWECTETSDANAYCKIDL